MFWGLSEILDSLDLPVPVETMVELEILELLDLLDHLDRKVRVDRWDQRDQLETLDQLDQWDGLVLMELLAHVVLSDSKVMSATSFLSVLKYTTLNCKQVSKFYNL